MTKHRVVTPILKSSMRSLSGKLVIQMSLKQAVHSGIIAAATSNQEGLAATRASLAQHEALLRQITENQAFFGPPREVSSASDLTSKKIAVFRNHHFCVLPIEALHVSESSTFGSTSGNLAPEECSESKMLATIVPPSWLSHTIINFSIRLSCDLHSLNAFRWHSHVELQHQRVNYNLEFIRAVKNVDVDALRKLFEQGLARPTDWLICYRHPCLWYKVRLDAAVLRG